MNKERLTKLADFLDTVPEHKFDLESWRSDSTGDESWEALVDDAHLLNFDCGTTGCAVGWACVMPEFQAEGLAWGVWGPTATGYSGWFAVMDFFGLKRVDAEYLFSGSEYDDDAKKPTDVAARIRELTA